MYRSSASVATDAVALFKMMSLADSAVWSSSTSLVKRSSVKPLQEPSTCVPSNPAQGADSTMEGEVWWVNFQRLKVLSKDHEKMRCTSDVSMKVNSQSCPCRKKTPVRGLHHFSLCARECFPLVGERVQMRFSHRGRLPSYASLCQHRSLLPSSSEEAVPICREVFITPSETIPLTVAANRLFHQGQRTWIMRVPSIPFSPLRLSMTVRFEWCALHDVWSARCACTRTETNSRFARVHIFADFVISSSRRGPSDRHDGEAHMRKSSAGPLQRGAALRLLPFASSFAVRSCYHTHVQRLERRQVRLEFSFRFLDVDHKCVHSPSRARHRHVSFHVFLFRTGSRQLKGETFADSNTFPTQQLRQSVYFVASAIFQCSMQLRF